MLQIQSSFYSGGLNNTDQTGIGISLGGSISTTTGVSASWDMVSIAFIPVPASQGIVYPTDAIFFGMT